MIGGRSWRMIGLTLLALTLLVPLGVFVPAAADVDGMAAPRPPPRRVTTFTGASLATNALGWAQVVRRSDARGVLVLQVVPAFAAATSGLVVGDVITSVDGVAATNDRQLTLLWGAEGRVGHTLSVVGVDGVARSLEIVPGERPGSVDALIERMVRDDPSVLNRLVYAQSLAGTSLSISVLDDILHEHPGFAEAHALKASMILRIANQVGSMAEQDARVVRESAERASELDPGSLSVAISAGHAFIALGELELAEIEASRALSIDDRSASAHNLYGRIQAARGNAAGGVASMRRAVELDPYTGGYYEDLAGTYRALGDEKAAQATEMALTSLDSIGDAGTRRRVIEDPDRVRNLVLVLAAGLVIFCLGPSLFRRITGQRLEQARRWQRQGSPLVQAELVGVIAIFIVLTPWLAEQLAMSPGAGIWTEIFNHVLPGVLCLVLSGLSIRFILLGRAPADWAIGLAILVGIAGLVVSVSHVPLVFDALRGEVRYDTLAFHGIAGPILIVQAAILFRSPPTFGPVDEGMASMGSGRPESLEPARANS